MKDLQTSSVSTLEYTIVIINSIDSLFSLLDCPILNNPIPSPPFLKHIATEAWIIKDPDLYQKDAPYYAFITAHLPTTLW